MPESFENYCKRQGGEFTQVLELNDQAVLDKLGLHMPENEKLLL